MHTQNTSLRRSLQSFPFEVDFNWVTKISPAFAPLEEVTINMRLAKHWDVEVGCLKCLQIQINHVTKFDDTLKL